MRRFRMTLVLLWAMALMSCSGSDGPAANLTTPTPPGGGHAEMVGRVTSLQASASTVGGSDNNGEFLDEDLPFANYSGSFSAQSSGETNEGQTHSAEAGASMNAQYEVSSESRLVRFSGNANASAVAGGGGGNAHAVAWTALLVSVIDEAVSYDFSGALANENCFATIEKRESTGGGWESPPVFDTHAENVSNSGSLTPGIYRIKVGAVADMSGASTSTGSTPSSSFSFDFKIVAPN